MVYLSGLFFPLPPFLQQIAPMWPAYHLNRLVLHTAGVVKASPLSHVEVLVVVTVVCTAVAVRRLARAG